DHAGSDGRLPKTINGREKRRRVVQSFGQLAGAGICVRSICRHKAFGCEQRETLRQLQLDLLPVPSRTLGELRQYRETAVEITDRLKMRGASGCMAAGPWPLTGGALGVVGRGHMMGQNLGLALDEVSEMLLQHRRDTSV